MIDWLTAIHGGEPLADVLILSVVIGGLCAWLTGRAIARTWRSRLVAVAAMLPLGAALRFMHFALYEGPLLSAPAYVTDTIFLIVVALIAWQRTRTLQMTRQYYWLYASLGPLFWREKSAAECGKAPQNGA